MTDPGFGSYWTVNLEAPPGTKRPRKRGRPVKNAADGEKRRGRPRKEDGAPGPVSPGKDGKNTSHEVEDTEMTHFDIDGGSGDINHPSGDEDYESEEETTLHPFERRTSLIPIQLSAYPQPPSSSAALPRSPFSGDDDPSNIIERLDIEVTSLRRQAADAVQVSMRLTDQLAQAQAEASRAKSASKRLEVMLEEEARKRREAEQAADEEARLRWQAEDELKRLSTSPTTPI